MNGFNVLKAMEHIDEGLIEETYRHKRASRFGKVRVMISLAASVACIGIVLAMCVNPLLKSTSQKGSSTAEAVLKSTSETRKGILNMETITRLDERLTRMADDATSEEMERECRKMLQEYGIVITYQVEADTIGTYEVIDEDGSAEYYYELYKNVGENGDVQWEFCPHLVHEHTGAIYYMTEENEVVLEDYLENTRKATQRINEALEYLENTLKTNQYAGIDTKNQDVGVELTYQSLDSMKITVLLEGEAWEDEQLKEQLDSHGLSYRKKFVSYDKVNAFLKTMWEERTQYGVGDVCVNLSVNDKEVILVGDKNGRDKFTEYVDSMQVFDGNEWLTTFTSYIYEEKELYLSYTKGLEDIDEFVAYIQEYDKQWMDSDNRISKEYETYIKELKTALTKLKEAYPEYNYLQLYYHIASDLDYKSYLNFDQELNTFVDGLDHYEEDKIYTDELEYGDPQMLELKRMLAGYKELYPELSYEELYEKCGYQAYVEENTVADNHDRLMWALSKKAELNAELEAAANQKNIVFAVKGLAVAGACGAVIVTVLNMKKKKNRKSENV